MSSSDQADATEQLLCDAFRRQAEHYAAALEVARQLFAETSRWEVDVQSLEQIRGHLHHVESIDSNIRQAREAWHASGSRPGSELQAIVDRLKPVVEELLVKVAAAEQRAHQSKALLAPKLDNQAQSLRMRRAYSATEHHG